MCYDITYLTKRQIDYAKKYGKEEDVRDIKEKLPATYHSNGFQHAHVPVISSENPEKINLYQWGLIPFWAKEDNAYSIWNKTLNARGESIFDKPSFRKAAKTQRCLVLVDGFFEHHHVGKKSIPFFIQQKNEEPFTLGGIFDIWIDQNSGEEKHTFSIVTTKANERMAYIHNNPKVLANSGPRMPLILDRENENHWLDTSLSKSDVVSLIKPFPQELLKDYPVAPIKGKNSKTNSKHCHNPKSYPELSQLGLF